MILNIRKQWDLLTPFDRAMYGYEYHERYVPQWTRNNVRYLLSQDNSVKVIYLNVN